MRRKRELERGKEKEPDIIHSHLANHPRRLSSIPDNVNEESDSSRDDKDDKVVKKVEEGRMTSLHALDLMSSQSLSQSSSHAILEKDYYPIPHHPSNSDDVSQYTVFRKNRKGGTSDSDSSSSSLSSMSRPGEVKTTPSIPHKPPSQGEDDEMTSLSSTSYPSLSASFDSYEFFVE